METRERRTKEEGRTLTRSTNRFQKRHARSSFLSSSFQLIAASHSHTDTN